MAACHFQLDVIKKGYQRNSKEKKNKVRTPRIPLYLFALAVNFVYPAKEDDFRLL